LECGRPRIKTAVVSRPSNTGRSGIRRPTFAVTTIWRRPKGPTRGPGRPKAPDPPHNAPRERRARGGSCPVTPAFAEVISRNNASSRQRPTPVRERPAAISAAVLCAQTTPQRAGATPPSGAACSPGPGPRPGVAPARTDGERALAHRGQCDAAHAQRRSQLARRRTRYHPTDHAHVRGLAA
jgi:hypothetical protein